MASPLPPSPTPITSSSHTTIHKLTHPFFFSPKPSPFIPRAAADPDPEPSNSPPSPEPTSTDDPFESRLAEVRLRYRSGTGKKAEVRKTKKNKTGSSFSSNKTSVLLPPVPLKEPMSGGLKVEFGFSPYSERVNGRLAGLGLVALLLVELASGKSVVSYHTPAIVFIQLYFMAAACALFLKYEKEKVSVWPNVDVSSSSSANQQ